MPEARSLPARVAVRALCGLIRVYQVTLSPALAVAAPSCGCRFAPTCSHYAQDALRLHGPFAGAVLALRRLAKCGPWHPGGLDPVPPSLSCVRVRPTGAPLPLARASGASS
jgi:putative membrane protein insertion efficiency factor